jgi:NADH-quinone oxidoreductase subunit F
MDLRIETKDPTPAEREAVDAALRAHGADTPASGHASRERRHLLLPLLHALQDRCGWLSKEGLGYVARRLDVAPAEVYSVASFYHWFSLEERAATIAHVCDDIACRSLGALELCSKLEAEGVPFERSPCLGLCERAPAALVVASGALPVSATVVDMKAPKALADALKAPSLRPLDTKLSVPQAGSPGLELLARVGRTVSLENYLAFSGYEALKKALALGPEKICAEVTASRVLGRGGAAFPAGRKWTAVLRQKARPHYVVCNADESEPGTFKDRVLLEEDPFAVIEGLTIAGLATGSEKGFIYLRAEYPLALRRLEQALSDARRAGWLGVKIQGSDFSFDIEVRRGGAAYICGEETALFASIEGFRGEPRSKPPFPVEVGLFGKPTAINNVETLANVPIILRKGGALFAKTGTQESTGTKLFCVSGHVERPGLYEVPFGKTLEEVLELAGGVRDGRAAKAILLGGAAGVFVGPEKLSMPLTFEGTRAAGATLGSGVVMVFDDGTDLGDVLERIATFFKEESCGQCVPCRVGTERQEELVLRLGRGRPLGSLADEQVLLNDLGQCMKDASICGLGQTASSAIASALARFPEAWSRPSKGGGA